MDCFREWRTLLNLAVPSCISVCLEWWCFSVSTRVGNEIGANNPKKAKLAAIVGLCCSFMLGLSALVFATVRNIWATMFTQDKDIIALTSMVLPIIGLCELGNCPQTTGCGVLRGTRMEPICGQAFGAKKHTLLGLSLQRTVLLLLFTSLPISLLWLNMKKILLICGQDEAIAAEGTQNDSKEPKTLISPLISKTITPQPEQVHKTQFKPHKKSHFSLVLKEANSIAAIAVPMIFIVYLIFSSSNISPAMARPLNKEKPAWTGFMLYEIDRAPAPPTGPSKCIPPGRLNEHGDCPTPFHP
ncbi:hypothetical protein ACFXTH_001824 [Malus domestica]